MTKFLHCVSVELKMDNLFCTLIVFLVIIRSIVYIFTFINIIVFLTNHNNNKLCIYLQVIRIT